MANAETRYKNAARFAAGVALTPQTANPLPSSEYGIWADSSGNLRGSALGYAVGIASLRGIVPSARLVMITNPSNTNTVTIGGHVFKFLTTLIAADTTTQIKILGSAALTRAAFVNAINGTTDANTVAATTPFAGLVVADQVSTSIRLRQADARGGNAVAAAATSVTLAETLANAADIWNCANMNVSGKAASDCQITIAAVTITAEMVTAAGYQIELPFTPTTLHWTCSASTGVQRAITDAITISTNAINIALAGGASPAIQAGDIFRFTAIA